MKNFLPSYPAQLTICVFMLGISAQVCGMQQASIISDLSGLVSPQDEKILSHGLEKTNESPRNTSYPQKVLESPRENQSPRNSKKTEEITVCESADCMEVISLASDLEVHQHSSEAEYISASDFEGKKLKFTRAIKVEPDGQQGDPKDAVSTLSSKKGAIATGVATASLLAAAGTYFASRFFKSESSADGQKVFIKFSDGKVAALVLLASEISYFGTLHDQVTQNNGSHKALPIEIGVTEEEFITLLRYVTVLLTKDTLTLEATLHHECDFTQIMSGISRAEKLRMSELLECMLKVFIKKLNECEHENLATAVQQIESGSLSDYVQRTLIERIYPHDKRQEFIHLVRTHTMVEGFVSFVPLGENFYSVLFKQGTTNRLVVYDVLTHEERQAFSLDEEIRDVTLQDEEIVVCTSSEMYRADLTRGEVSCSLKLGDPKAGAILACSSHEKDHKLAIGLSNKVMLLNGANKKLSFLHAGKTGYVEQGVGLYFSQDGSHLAELRKSGNIFFWNCATQKLVSKAMARQNDITHVAVIKEYLVMAGDKNVFDVWTFDGKKKCSVAISGTLLALDHLSGNALVVDGNQTYLRTLDCENGTFNNVQVVSETACLHAAFSPHSSTFCLLLNEHELQCVHVDDFRKTTLKQSHHVKRVAYCSSDSILAIHQNGYTMWYAFDNVLTYLREPKNLSQAFVYEHFRMLAHKDESTLDEVSRHVIKGEKEAFTSLLQAIW